MTEKRSRCKAAETVQQMASLFYSSLDRGMRVHLKVKTLLQAGRRRRCREKAQERSAISWMSGPRRAIVATISRSAKRILVYANNEEGADYFFTSICMRTKRLSDAGDDLAYLYYYKNQPEASSRLEGFATSDRKSQLTMDATHEPAAIGAPVGGVILQVKSDRLTRYAESDNSGRFLFDGLPEANYEYRFCERLSQDQPIASWTPPLEYQRKELRSSNLCLAKDWWLIIRCKPDSKKPTAKGLSPEGTAMPT